MDVRIGYLWMKTVNFGVILENMGYNVEVTTVYDAELKVSEPATIKAAVHLKKMLVF